MPKKSFFGKIMGNEPEAENEPALSGAEYAAEADEERELEVLDGDETESDEEEEMVEEVTIRAKETKAAPVKAETGPHEEWLSDYEGQLNIDMYQTKDNVIIKSTIAGVGPDDMDITVANDMVTIKGTRQKEQNVAEDDYFYQECYWGNFSRSVIIPVDIDSEHIEADLKDGMLTIVVPKAAKAKTKKIKVKGL